MPKKNRVVYLTFDGILQPLGHSQVLRIVAGLAARGFDYEIVSLEREADLADPRRVEAMRRLVREAGIAWSPIRYAVGGYARNVAGALAALLRAAPRAALVHARSYVAAGVARTAMAATRVPYLFDARGYWIDERREAGIHFRGARSEALARRVERNLYRESAGVVALTELMAADVRDGRFGPFGSRPSIAIPTCADYDEFRIREDVGATDPPDPALAGKLVVGIIGSINFSYHTDQSFELARRILERRSDAVLLVASSQKDEMRARATQAGIPSERLVLRSIPHAEMARWTRHVDVTPHLLVETPAKRGSMPTKLAELFASGVRPLHVGCNTEVTDWIRRAGSGVVLASVAPDELERAAVDVATTPRDVSALRRAREITAPHFSLESGIERYARLLHRLGVATR